MFKTGLDQLIDDANLRAPLVRRRVALLAHPASVTADLTHALDALGSLPEIKLTAAFGPQHGLRGDKQDNMVESAHVRDPVLGVPVWSLYADVRRPTAEMLAGIDALLVDLQDVGCRVYTFITTLRYLLEDCAARGKSLWVLDRPNPAGRPVEGNLLQPGWESFVGAGPLPWHPIALRIPLLDQLEETIARCRDPMWRAMALCRFAEVYTHYLLAVAATGVPDRLLPRLREHERPLSFGSVRALLREATNAQAHHEAEDALTPWREFAVRLHGEKHKRLDRMVEARNDLAHSRPARVSPDKLEDELRDLVVAHRWRDLRQPPLAGLEPWLVDAPAGAATGSSQAIVERYLPDAAGPCIRYVDPVSSVTFEQRPA